MPDGAGCAPTTRLPYACTVTHAAQPTLPDPDRSLISALGGPDAPARGASAPAVTAAQYPIIKYSTCMIARKSCTGICAGRAHRSIGHATRAVLYALSRAVSLMLGDRTRRARARALGGGSARSREGAN